MKLCISIINWHSASQTIACLQSLEALIVPQDVTLRTIIVDNASQDDSVAKIRRAYPALDIILSPENLGFAGGHRLALAEAQTWGADVFWILNPDLIVEPEALIELLKAFHQLGPALYGSVPLAADDPQRIGIRARAVDKNGQPLIDKIAVRGGIKFDDAFVDNKPVRVANLSGCSLLIPLALVEKHGFMQENFFMYTEEVDYCFRLAKRGVGVYVVPASRVVHQLGGTSTSFKAVKPVLEYYEVRNRLVFTRRYGGWRRLIPQAWLEAKRAVCWRLIARRLFFPWRPPIHSSNYYKCLGLRDALLNRLGRTFDPNDFTSSPHD